MNLLTIIILLVLLVFAINGYMRGFARTLTSLLYFVFSGVLVYYSTPMSMISENADTRLLICGEQMRDAGERCDHGQIG